MQLIARWALDELLRKREAAAVMSPPTPSRSPFRSGRADALDHHFARLLRVPSISPVRHDSHLRSGRPQVSVWDGNASELVSRVAVERSRIKLFSCAEAVGLRRRGGNNGSEALARWWPGGDRVRGLLPPRRRSAAPRQVGGHGRGSLAPRAARPTLGRGRPAAARRSPGGFRRSRPKSAQAAPALCQRHLFLATATSIPGGEAVGVFDDVFVPIQQHRSGDRRGLHLSGQAVIRDAPFLGPSCSGRNKATLRQLQAEI